MKGLELNTKNDFTRQVALDLINNLKEDQKPLWGIMTAQHMIEHVSLTVGASVGKINTKVFTPQDKIEYYKKVGLFTDTTWPVGTKSPALSDKLADLHYATFEEAKSKLIIFINAYFDLFDQKSDIISINPVFGELTIEEWKQFHFKHFRHHFTQFDIL